MHKDKILDMLNKSKNYYQAIAVLIGQIVGVGIFGMPFLFAKAGLLSLLFFIVFIGLVQYFIHLVYANLVLATPTYHQLPGYTEMYLGRRAKNFIFVTNLIGNYCALLAYTIVSSAFLCQLLSPVLGGSEFIYAVVIFSIEAAIVFFGVHFLARVELVMAFLLVFIVSLIAWRSFDFIQVSNYITVNWKYFLIPYGAMLFTLDGTPVIPFIVELLDKNKDDVKKVVRIGTLIPTVITAIFSLVIIGISGANITPDALIGIKSVLRDGVVVLSLVFGVLCIFTSFIGSAQSLRKIYHWDYKINKHLAWFFTMSIPFLLYLAGINDFINVISFAGAVSGGISAIVLITIVSKINNDVDKIAIFKRRLPSFFLYTLITMFTAGILYEIFCFLL